MKKMTNRQKQAIDTKLKIIKIGMELFQKEGFDQVTVRQICQKASISIGAFYHHFHSKQELIKVGQESIDKVILDKFYNVEFEGTLEDILRVMETSMEVLLSFGHEFIVGGYIEMLKNKEAYVISEERVLFQFLLDIINKGKEQMLIYDSEDAYEMVRHILRITRGVIYEWGHRSGDLDLKKVVTDDLKAYFRYREDKSN